MYVAIQCDSFFSVAGRCRLLLLLLSPSLRHSATTAATGAPTATTATRAATITTTATIATTAVTITTTATATLYYFALASTTLQTETLFPFLALTGFQKVCVRQGERFILEK